MEIDIRHDIHGSYYIFKFKKQNDFDIFIENCNKLCSALDIKKSRLNRIKLRLTEKYGDDKFPYSVIIFDDDLPFLFLLFYKQSLKSIKK